MRLAVRSDGSVAVTVPSFLRENFAEQFIREKADWLLSKLVPFVNFEGLHIPRQTRRDYLENKEAARILIERKITKLNEKYGYKFGRISIRNQKTCWGSCSRKGNLNFNYKIMFLPESIQDYIIVHELCHLKEFNHSKKFWNLVSITVPNYSEIRRGLRKNQINSIQ
jgi:predicted metal-dependent hydrolase